MLLLRRSPRTSIVTRAVWFAKLRTAWPAELPSLPPGQPGHFGPADPVGKPEEVLDHGGVRGLAARYVAVADERRKAVRGGVDGGCEPCRPCADDDEVVLLALCGLVTAPR